jgi:hypothetical protein
MSVSPKEIPHTVRKCRFDGIQFWRYLSFAEYRHIPPKIWAVKELHGTLEQKTRVLSLKEGGLLYFELLET